MCGGIRGDVGAYLPCDNAFAWLIRSLEENIDGMIGNASHVKVALTQPRPGFSCITMVTFQHGSRLAKDEAKLQYVGVYTGVQLRTKERMFFSFWLHGKTSTPNLSQQGKAARLIVSAAWRQG